MTLLIVALLLPLPLWAKLGTFHFDNFAAAQGLKNSYAIKILQGPQGYIWVGTQDGLFRYDGYQFKAFINHPDDPHSLGDNYIQAMYIDKQQRLWIGTRSGLSLFNHKTLKFKHYIHHPDKTDSLAHNYVMDIIEDKEGVLWVGTFGGGLSRFNAQTQNFTHFVYDANNPNSLSDNRVYTLLNDHLGFIWVGTRNGGLNRFNHQTGQFKRYQHQPDNPQSLSHNKVYALFETSNGTLWVGTRGGGLNQLNRENDTFEHFVHNPNDNRSLGNDHIYSLFADKSDTLWVGTLESGLHRFNQQAGDFDRYQYNRQHANSLPDNDVFAITQDQSGLIWVGTFGGGISKFDPDSERFGLMQHNPNNPDSLSSGDVYAIFKDSQNTLWVGTRNGLNIYDAVNDRFERYHHNPDDPNSLGDNYVTVIAEDSANNIWIGTGTRGLSRLNRQQNTFDHYRNVDGDNNSLSDDIIRVIREDSQGHLWIGTSSGLNRFNPQTQDFTRYHYDMNNPGSISSDTIYTLYTDRQGILWVGTSEGLNRYNRQTDSFSHYRNIVGEKNSLSHNSVYAIYQDPQGVFWLGTGGGLNKFDISGQTFTHYRKSDGLPSDGIFSVLPDRYGNLWLGVGEQTITMFDPQTLAIKNNVGNAANCNSGYNVYFLADDGQLFFGHDGYCAFYPEQAIRSSHPPTLVFTDFRILNVSTEVNTNTNDAVLTQVINHTEAITLNHQQNVLSFEFAALHYANPSANRYQYKLDGFHQQWVKTTADNRRATFTNLAAGDYIFRFIASNNEGVWNPQQRTIKLTIKPAPWRTWWAYTAYLLISGLLVGAFGWQRYQRGQALILAKDNAEKANRAKSAFIANVSHEIRTPLNAVLGYTQLLERDKSLKPEQRHKLEIIEKSGSHLLGLINDILDISKIEAKGMTLITMDFELVSLVKGIAIMLSGRCDEKHLSWQLVNQCGPSVSVHGDQCKLRQILINLLGNAVKFTNEGSVTLTLSGGENNHYTFEVSDTGPGIEPAQQTEIFTAFSQTTEGAKHGGTGLGLAIASAQVNLMGGQLTLESTPGKGSRFFFTLMLPAAKKAVTSRQPRLRRVLKLAAEVSVTALVVDDIKENRTILKLMLQSIGINVFEAVDGQDALNKLHQASRLPELVFMDIRMPQMDGITALKRIHRDFKVNCPTCIVITAHAMQAEIERYLQLGFDHCIAKPLRIEEVYQCVYHLLDVEFEYQDESASNAVTSVRASAKSSLSAADFCTFRMPGTLCKALRDAAANAEISKLESLLEQLSELSEQGEQLANRLGHFISSYDMEGLVDELERLCGHGQNDKTL